MQRTFTFFEHAPMRIIFTTYTRIINIL